MSFMPSIQSSSIQDDTPKCFVIMPFSTPAGYPKDHFNMIYEDIFIPAIISAGFAPIRCDEIINGNPVPQNMFDHLDNDPIVLCDLSSYNPNVLYELGRRHSQNKSAVLVQEEGQEYIYDLQAQGYTVISYRKSRYYREVVEDQEKIRNAILHTVYGSDTKKEISFASGITEIRALRTEYYKYWPITKRRQSFQNEPPSETSLTSIAHDRLVSILLRGPEIRHRITSQRDDETLQFARSVLQDLDEAMRQYICFYNDYDDIADATRLQRSLHTYISSFNE